MKKFVDNLPATTPLINSDFNDILQEQHRIAYSSYLDGLNDEVFIATGSNSGIILRGLECDETTMTNVGTFKWKIKVDEKSLFYAGGQFYSPLDSIVEQSKLNGGYWTTTDSAVVIRVTQSYSALDVNGNETMKRIFKSGFTSSVLVDYRFFLEPVTDITIYNQPYFASFEWGGTSRRLSRLLKYNKHVKNDIRIFHNPKTFYSPQATNFYDFQLWRDVDWERGLYPRFQLNFSGIGTNFSFGKWYELGATIRGTFSTNRKLGFYIYSNSTPNAKLLFFTQSRLTFYPAEGAGNGALTNTPFYVGREVTDFNDILTFRLLDFLQNLSGPDFNVSFNTNKAHVNNNNEYFPTSPGSLISVCVEWLGGGTHSFELWRNYVCYLKVARDSNVYTPPKPKEAEGIPPNYSLPTGANLPLDPYGENIIQLNTANKAVFSLQTTVSPAGIGRNELKGFAPVPTMPGRMMVGYDNTKSVTPYNSILLSVNYGTPSNIGGIMSATLSPSVLPTHDHGGFTKASTKNFDHSHKFYANQFTLNESIYNGDSGDYTSLNNIPGSSFDARTEQLVPNLFERHWYNKGNGSGELFRYWGQLDVAPDWGVETLRPHLTTQRLPNPASDITWDQLKTSIFLTRSQIKKPRALDYLVGGGVSFVDIDNLLGLNYALSPEPNEPDASTPYDSLYNPTLYGAYYATSGTWGSLPPQAGYDFYKTYNRAWMGNHVHKMSDEIGGGNEPHENRPAYSVALFMYKI